MRPSILTCAAALLKTIAVAAACVIGVAFDVRGADKEPPREPPPGCVCYVACKAEGKFHSGTGFCVASENGLSLVATAGHVVPADGTITVEVGRRSYAGTFIASGGLGLNDVALVVVEGVLPVAPLAKEEAVVGAKLRLWGYGGYGAVVSRCPAFKTGVVTNCSPQFLDSTIPVIGGDSGGAWFNDQGAVVGLTSLKSEDEKRRGIAMPLGTLRAFIRKHVPLFPHLSGLRAKKGVPLTPPPAPAFPLKKPTLTSSAALKLPPLATPLKKPAWKPTWTPPAAPNLLTPAAPLKMKPTPRYEWMK